MNSSERKEHLLKLQATQEEYYKQHTKHKVFKMTQKKECANYVASTNTEGVERMIECTVFIVPNTNIVYFNYLVFKTYGDEESSKLLYFHLLKCIQKILSSYDSFEFHIDLKTFTVSACQRYYSMIVSGIDNNQLFAEKLNKLIIYNTPTIIGTLTRLLYNSVKIFLHKTEYVKEKSEERIADLFKDV